MVYYGLCCGLGLYGYFEDEVLEGADDAFVVAVTGGARTTENFVPAVGKPTGERVYGLL